MMKKQIFANKEACCGCGACAEVCSQNIIQMQPDSEGFLYPQVVDESRCIDCGACLHICPVTHAEQIDSAFSVSYAGWVKDEPQIVRSASGGAAAALYAQILKQGGAVYGVAYCEDFYAAVYKRADSPEQTEAFWASKYIQASKEGLYAQLREDIRQKKSILFIGLPCEVHAVKQLFPKYDKLYLVSLICHGPTSASIQEAFCKALEEKYQGKITGFSVRHKRDGKWKPYYVCADFDNGKRYLAKFEDTDYDTAFLNFKRPSCGSCVFKGKHFSADLVIGDYHSASPKSGHYHPSGVSCLLPLTDRGNALVELLKDVFVLKQTPLDTAIKQKGLNSPVACMIDREGFAQTLHSDGLGAACKRRDIAQRADNTRKARRKRKTVSGIKGFLRKILGR